MGRKKVSEPPQSCEWLMREIAEMNDLLPPKDRDEAYCRRYRTLIANRRNLDRLIELVPLAINSNLEIWHVVQDSVKVMVDARGRLELLESGLIRRIIDAKIPIDRLRICPVCDKVYWLKTRRGITCGKACAGKAYDEKRSQTRRKEKRQNGSV